MRTGKDEEGEVVKGREEKEDEDGKAEEIEREREEDAEGGMDKAGRRKKGE